jgi:hypothetical protein
MLQYKSALKEYNKSDGGVMPDEPEHPVRVRYLSNDATIEAIAQILIDNPHGILLTLDELSGFFKTLNKTGREGDRAFWLEAFNGNGSKSIDRIGRGSLFVPNVCASIFGTIQPDAILPMISFTKDGASGGDGLLQRFQVMAMVERNDFKYVDRKPNFTAKKEYSDIVTFLLSADPLEYGANKDDYDDTIYYGFSKEASELFREWSIGLNEKIKTEQEHNPVLSAHLGKYTGLFASIALILFYVDRVAGRAATSTIPKEYALKAQQWCDLLESHSRNIYDIDRLAETKRDALDEKILVKVRELQNTGQLPMTFGKIAIAVRGANADTVKKALDGVAVIKSKKVFGFL